MPTAVRFLVGCFAPLSRWRRHYVIPTGLGVFKAGGSLSFHHGGFSLQELIVPVVSLRMTAGKPAKVPCVQVRIDGYPAVVTNRTFGLKVGDLLSTEQIVLRVVLMAGAEEVGRMGMAVGGKFDRGKGTLTLAPGTEASVGMMLRDWMNALRCTELKSTDIFA
jgi:hypothetical protein